MLGKALFCGEELDIPEKNVLRNALQWVLDSGFGQKWNLTGKCEELRVENILSNMERQAVNFGCETRGLALTLRQYWSSS